MMKDLAYIRVTDMDGLWRNWVSKPSPIFRIEALSNLSQHNRERVNDEGFGMHQSYRHGWSLEELRLEALSNLLHRSPLQPSTSKPSPTLHSTIEREGE
ncbi:hypothetical protein AVEN_182482-1 [Araneus ventricosus]|uniref:Uncharacterized protein n=1 Tax=Araneus ventricosus TaxID=182803 RepID=A0A4Y2XAS6_ARAVE|nr:hypothetical protein AVEN_248799-1 [Araneus ventricosus]GBO46263.1 hypothetical protein AVEN_35115-1 [Araneus ventricosus]GBO46271.1 hypothetical protein AVEN_182482-1 [Araneus ventricosus]